VTIRQALRQAEANLASHGIDDARLEAEILLMHTLRVGRAQLYLELERELPPPLAEKFWHLVRRRSRHEPIAYILNSCEFFGLDFYVDPRVLIPRPESELLVEKALELALGRSNPSSTAIAEVGTGSGAIAIAIATHLPGAEIYATDISPAALQVASINCRRHRVENRIRLLQGDMLQPLPEPIDLIIANPPYIRDSDLSLLQPEIRNFEPQIALAGGKEGLGRIKGLLTEVRDKLHPRGSILIELGKGQAQAVLSLVEDLLTGSEAKFAADLGGIDRVLQITLA
jgi:release factor glutamine methyltransferase